MHRTPCTQLAAGRFQASCEDEPRLVRQAHRLTGQNNARLTPHLTASSGVGYQPRRKGRCLSKKVLGTGCCGVAIAAVVTDRHEPLSVDSASLF